MGHRLRSALASVDRKAVSPADVSPDDLKQTGAHALALDFDGILAPHGQPRPLPVMEAWIERTLTLFSPEKVFIVSNKPDEPRIRYLNSRFPGIRFIAGTRKKPYPDGLLMAASLAGTTPNRVVLIDDRLMTGVLAACIAGSPVIYITRPYTDFTKRPLTELFFFLLRAGERLLVYKLK